MIIYNSFPFCDLNNSNKEVQNEKGHTKHFGLGTTSRRAKVYIFGRNRKGQGLDHISPQCDLITSISQQEIKWTLQKKYAIQSFLLSHSYY